MFSLRLESLAVRWMAGACAALVVASANPGRVDGQSVVTELRGGASLPAGDMAEVGDPGAALGVGLGWMYNSRVALRVDGDFEMLNEGLAGGVITPRTYLWHLHGGVEIDLLDPETSTWLARIRGGAGGTIYDTRRLTPNGDDFLDTYFSVSGGLSLGTMVNDWLEVGGFGKVNVVFTEKDRTREISDLNPAILNPFSKGSTFPVGLYLRWRGLMPQR